MKVSIIGIKGYPIVYGGYETLVKSIVKRLNRFDVDVTIYCHKKLFDERPKYIDGINLVYLPAWEKMGWSQFTHSFLATIHACFSDTNIIFYVNVANSPFGLIAKLFFKKTIINVDGIEWERPKWKGFGSVYYKITSRLAKHFFDCVITDAIAMQEIYKSRLDCDSVVITYGAEECVKYDHSILTKYNLVKSNYYLVVGRMIPDNNLDFIIDDYIKSNSIKPLVVVGGDFFESSFVKEIFKKISKYKNIILTGYINDPDQLSTLYKYSSAYIHGHEYGGTNPTMITAMKEGCVILALDTIFTREMLSNGDAGIFFEKKEFSLAELIKKIENFDIETRYNLYRSNAKSIADEKYNWDLIAKSYLEVFNKILI